MKNYLVTSALPYANGPLHFGHLAGVYLPSDVYVRHLRLMGERVKHICGSDEHGVAIMLNAKKAGKEYKEYVDGLIASISSVLLSPDDISTLLPFSET